MTHIVITGAAGRVGEVLVEEFNPDCTLTLLDRRRHPDFKVRKVNLASGPAAHAAVPRADVLIHLAANPSYQAPWHSLLPDNIRALYNVLEAARVRGIPQVILASSVMVYEGTWPVMYQGPSPDVCSPAALPQPRTVYAAMKLFAEHLGAVYAHTYGLRIICVRLGAFPHRGTARTALERVAPVLLSVNDCRRLFRCAVQAGPVKYLVLNGLSQQSAEYYDLSAAADIGYRPQDSLAEAIAQHLACRPQRRWRRLLARL